MNVFLMNPLPPPRVMEQHPGPSPLPRVIWTGSCRENLSRILILSLPWWGWWQSIYIVIRLSIRQGLSIFNVVAQLQDIFKLQVIGLDIILIIQWDALLKFLECAPLFGASMHSNLKQNSTVTNCRASGGICCQIWREAVSEKSGEHGEVWRWNRTLPKSEVYRRTGKNNNGNILQIAVKFLPVASTTLHVVKNHLFLQVHFQAWTACSECLWLYFHRFFISKGPFLRYQCN